MPVPEIRRAAFVLGALLAPLPAWAAALPTTCAPTIEASDVQVTRVEKNGVLVLVDGRAVKSCTMLAVQADGHEISTVEGLATASELHPLQEGFKEEHGLQCGFCTPGMMMAAKALLEENPDPTEEDVRWALSGNLCRCTGYQNIVKSVLWAAEKLRS